MNILKGENYGLVSFIQSFSFVKLFSTGKKKNKTYPWMKDIPSLLCLLVKQKFDYLFCESLILKKVE